MVEVAQHNQETLILFAEHIARRDLDIIECDVSSAGRRRVGGLDSLGGYALAAFHEENGEALLGLARNGEVVGEVSVRNPSGRYS